MRLSQTGLGTIRVNNLDKSYPAQDILLQTNQLVQYGTGIYAYNNVPLKLRENVESVIKGVLDKYGCIEILLPTLQPAKLWEESGRLSKYKEHTNDHQKQIIGEFVKDGYLIELDDFNKLDEVLKEASTFKPKKYKSNNKKFVNNITKYIENDNHTSWYNRFRYVVNILFLVILIGIVILIVS